MKDHYHVLIVGGGTAGLTVAAQLRNQPDPVEVGLIEPSEKHYYQPIWTLVGGGVVPREVSERDEADYIPDGVTWIQDAVTAFDPDNNTVTTRDGRTIGYDYLVVAPGIQLDWHKIPGLKESLGSHGVCSNYSYDTVSYTWETLRNLKGGRALFTQPATPIKCGGAPQKIMYLAADHLRRKGLLDQTDIQFMTPGAVVFGVEAFARTLKKVIARYGITFNFKHELVEVRGPQQEAVFRVTDEAGNTSEKVVGFDMIHVTPPQSAPDFIKQSPLANADGWVDVDKYTLQHTRYPNVFGLGDAAGTPNAKTGAAVRKQAPTVVHNLLQLRATGALDHPKTYNGYASCPLVTGYGKLVLAEFDYDNNPTPSFPFDTTQERYSMYALKLYALPNLYWHGMLRGRA
ncbi:MAG: pyridine nucleotide-disulfide oxidoreductase [Rhodothermaceae bacterium]|nr:MAG: pyridine nucleotide-disulfide oxidoreductase [Rhodothermaceae bacterium]